MIIGVTGYTDKRPVIYPLIKLLQTMGDTLLITNDRRYLRFTGDFESPGHFQNTMVYVTDSEPESVWGELEHTVLDFTHVIYDLKNYLPDNPLDVLVVLSTLAFEEGEEDFLELFDDVEIVRARMCYDKKKPLDKDVIGIFPTLKMLAEIEYTETYKGIPPVSSQQVEKLLQKACGEPLGLEGKTISRVLRGGAFE